MRDRFDARLVCAFTLLLLSACGGGGGGTDGDSNQHPPGSNRAPTAMNMSVTATAGTPYQGTFSATDPDGDTLAATVMAAPSKGGVTISATNPMSFTYTPGAQQSGADSFTYV